MVDLQDCTTLAEEWVLQHAHASKLFDEFGKEPRPETVELSAFFFGASEVETMTILGFQLMFISTAQQCSEVFTILWMIECHAAILPEVFDGGWLQLIEADRILVDVFHAAKKAPGEANKNHQVSKGCSVALHLRATFGENRRETA